MEKERKKKTAVELVLQLVDALEASAQPEDSFLGQAICTARDTRTTVGDEGGGQ